MLDKIAIAILVLVSSLYIYKVIKVVTWMIDFYE